MYMEKVGEKEVHKEIELRLPARARIFLQMGENMFIILEAGNPGKR